MPLLAWLFFLHAFGSATEFAEPSSRDYDSIPRFTLEELERPENEFYASGLMPVVVTDVAGNWAASSKWGDLNYFMSKPALVEEIVDWYPDNLMKADDHPILTSLQNALYHFVNDGKPEYIQWRLTGSARKILFKDIDLNDDPHTALPKFLQWDWWFGRDGCMKGKPEKENFLRTTQWNMMLIGNQGAGMFLHPDSLDTGTWQAQLIGRKKWMLCSPDQLNHLYGAGAFDVFNPDYEKYPRFKDHGCVTDIMTPGEIMFYPSNWWHQTLNLDPLNIGMAGRAVTKYNYQGVRNHLHNKCTSDAEDISLKFKGASPNPTKKVCAQLPRCMELWRTRFEPGYVPKQRTKKRSKGVKESGIEDKLGQYINRFIKTPATVKTEL